MTMAQIERDILAGHFDRTLLRYRPRKLGKNPTEIAAVELFRKWANHHTQERQLTPGSQSRLTAIASKLEQFIDDKPAHKVTDSVAKDVVSRWSETTSNQTLKAYLYYLKLCWDWAKGKYHLAESNPWTESLTRSRSRSNSQPSKRTKPFTLPELQAIISAFKTHPQYKNYTDFVIFLAQTGCRVGEAAALKWGNIGADFSTVWIGESVSRGHFNQRGTKTGKIRTISLTPSARSMLIARRDRLNPKPDDLVFPSPKGKPIDDHNFCNRAWKKILTSCHIEYRTPYNLRHSAISHALANGANPIALAEQTGHDKRVMLSTYAHAIGQESLFVDIPSIHLETLPDKLITIESD
jgi:integrase